jgi:hypothetical protein
MERDKGKTDREGIGVGVKDGRGGRKGRGKAGRWVKEKIGGKGGKGRIHSPLVELLNIPLNPTIFNILHCL